MTRKIGGVKYFLLEQQAERRGKLLTQKLVDRAAPLWALWRRPIRLMLSLSELRLLTVARSAA